MAPFFDAAKNKSRKTPPLHRQAQILALQARGMTQGQIAAHFGVTRGTIAGDLAKIRPAAAQVKSLLSSVDEELRLLQSPKQIAEQYLQFVKSEIHSVGLQAQNKVLELCGVVTRLDELKAKTGAASGAVQVNVQLSWGTRPQWASVALDDTRDGVALDVTPSDTDVSRDDTGG